MITIYWNPETIPVKNPHNYRWQQVFSADDKYVAKLVRHNMRGWRLTLEYINRLAFENPVDCWVLDDNRKEAEKKIRDCQMFLKSDKQKTKLNVEIAREYPINELLSGSKWEMATSNRAKCCCPLHHEDNPSFTWYKNNNSYYCFGCGSGGDVIDLYMKLYKASFVEAVKKLT